MATQHATETPKTIYDLTVKNAKGNDVDLSVYKGKVLLIVNVSSKCGLTNSNYTELNQLCQQYKEQGLEILAFPCNQFGEEEPGSNKEIEDFVCTRFKSEFPIFDKIEVNGDNAAPLYKFLKSGKWGFFKDDIQWNFLKFLVDKDGIVVHRYYPTTAALSLETILPRDFCWNHGTACLWGGCLGGFWGQDGLNVSCRSELGSGQTRSFLLGFFQSVLEFHGHVTVKLDRTIPSPRRRRPGFEGGNSEGIGIPSRRKSEGLGV